MPRDHFAQSKASVKADLAEIAQLVDFLSQTVTVYSRTGELIASLHGAPPMRELIVQFRKRRIGDINTIYSFIYVQVWATFELFVRNALTSYIDEFCQRKADFSSLEKAGLVKKNIYHTARVFREIYTDSSINYLDLAKRLGTLTSDSKQADLNVATFSAYLSPPTVKGIEEALARLGIANFDWDRLGELDELQELFGTRKARETSAEVKSFLHASARKRNNIVHRGDKLQPITETELREAIKTFQEIAIGLIDFLQRDCHAKSA